MPKYILSELSAQRYAWENWLRRRPAPSHSSEASESEGAGHAAARTRVEDSWKPSPYFSIHWNHLPPTLSIPLTDMMATCLMSVSCWNISCVMMSALRLPARKWEGTLLLIRHTSVILKENCVFYQFDVVFQVMLLIKDTFYFNMLKCYHSVCYHSKLIIRR